MHEVWPQTVPNGVDEATAEHNDMLALQARMPNWTLAAGGVTRWGESSLANYTAYLDFLAKSGA